MKRNPIQMRWINKVGEEYANDPIANYIFLSSMPVQIFIIVMLLENLFFGICVNLLYYMSYVYITQKYIKKLEATKDWISIKADVLSIQIISQFCFGRRGRYFYPKITYVYRIENKKYISENVLFYKCSNLHLHEEAVALTKTLISDKRVLCFVNPIDHSQSFLVRNNEVPEYFIMALMFFFFSYTISYFKLFY